ncbi:MAG: hypothetical protein NTZ05_16100, partial [Chloroflexi bacterium]|nr:hypothetical protein [Chloroflexota bacterium]
MQRNPSSGAGARPVWRRFWALSIIALPLFAFMMDSFGSAPIIPALLGSPTQRETPTPVALAAANTSAAPAPSPASAPLPTATPQLQLPKLDGTTEFSAQLRAAETHLRRDEAAYQRYLDVTNKCDRLKPGSATVLQRNDLDEGIAALARWTQGSVTGVTECRIEVTTKLAFLEGRTAAEQQRILAAALSHESAHLARVLNVSWTWVVKIDSNWLHQAMS